MLARGEMDAVFAVTGAPADTIRALAARRPIRLLSLDPAGVQQLVSQQRTYVRFTIPRSTYRTQTEPAHSIATSAILVARRDLADALVEKVLRALYADVDYAGAGSLMGSLVSSRSAGIGLPVPLHLAAQRYHESLAQ